MVECRQAGTEAGCDIRHSETRGIHTNTSGQRLVVVVVVAGCLTPQ